MFCPNTEALTRAGDVDDLCDECGEPCEAAPATFPAIAIERARALAAAHGHLWGSCAPSEMAEIEMQAAIASGDLAEIHRVAAGWNHPGLPGGITGPNVEDVNADGGGGAEWQIHHTTLTGRLDWYCLDDGSALLLVNRPAPEEWGGTATVLIGEVSPAGAVEVRRPVLPQQAHPLNLSFGTRHVAALESALAALVGLAEAAASIPCDVRTAARAADLTEARQHAARAAAAAGAAQAWATNLGGSSTPADVRLRVALYAQSAVHFAAVAMSASGLMLLPSPGTAKLAADMAERAAQDAARLGAEAPVAGVVP